MVPKGINTSVFSQSLVFPESESGLTAKRLQYGTDRLKLIAFYLPSALTLAFNMRNAVAVYHDQHRRSRLAAPAKEVRHSLIDILNPGRLKRDVHFLRIFRDI
ncbi:MAG: hypothetical protein ACREEE_15790 [Dongiaceae bacterium]